ncbi:SAM-dependent methyltransferase [Picrophilus oshimae]|uniref:Ribosomal RNA large subunit methyltransferase E n=2 Tax=Picrophilus torridus (strain ATCC 700027 / DSM 9790 / JCM 10055 / NBRC 100828 / KAW 2/3) TaxID=1122961 RepID=RLME_PICTO|nr:RlmE family RNA methyltransferase [Picrophilus oshimae]Q6L1E2.1 RecName: Full=Ribosomal RNA large subunit methyltransferase E; AltName: Full=23S rRNA Um2552 methyltransferase; AltName: Full=rRNA (uridine-2'-O-)-methyltransferase [Picrophilus oshimae DSM 9789]AAT43210.1 FtsJ-like methyltransferase [Picrophilus oshimae DSM 9789]SMD30485.1 23S rRNA Um-2552 2'-O-methyltransferase [Picrophilus oshimae DSM 9789]
MNRKDKYYIRAKRENYRSRASYKIIEINNKYNIVSRGDNVLEFGSSPGGWTQVIENITQSVIIAVDINRMDPVKNTVFIKMNIFDDDIFKSIDHAMAENNIKNFDSILSDAMSRTSGIEDRDHYNSYKICERVMDISIPRLKNGGNIILKQFQGDMTNEFIKKWSGYFNYYKITKPKASRQHSREIYIIFLNRI